MLSASGFRAIRCKSQIMHGLRHDFAGWVYRLPIEHYVANNSLPSQTATLMTDGGVSGGGQTLSKGRLNFSTSARGRACSRTTLLR